MKRVINLVTRLHRFFDVSLCSISPVVNVVAMMDFRALKLFLAGGLGPTVVSSISIPIIILRKENFTFITITTNMCLLLDLKSGKLGFSKSLFTTFFTFCRNIRVLVRVVALRSVNLKPKLSFVVLVVTSHGNHAHSDQCFGVSFDCAGTA